MKDRIIYQIFLRPFTPEGTFAAAKEKLPHIASLGIDTVYLTSCCQADDDSNEDHFSPRQKASKTGNPKNPYRVSDYYALDEEYGSMDDLRAFVSTAHGLKLDVLFDVVYLHCGPGAVFLEDHPEFVTRDENGNVVYNAWCFPEINYKSPELRRYLIDNMKFWIEECDFDGFRCDVGDQIPLDFWAEAVSELKALKPSLYMLNEGVKPEYTEVFDSNYNFLWTQAIQTVARGQNPASFLRKTDEACRKTYGSHPYVTLRALETHDYANDHYENRPDKALPQAVVDCAHLTDLMLDGIPFLYNGNEIADGRRHSIWGNRDYGKFCIDWSMANTPVGKARLELLHRTIALRRENPWLSDAETTWLDNAQGDKIAVFMRKREEKAMVVVANFGGEHACDEIALPNAPERIQPLLSRDGAATLADHKLTLNVEGYGFAIVALK